jgi:RNA polymerase sigma-70 factor (ECF subfamily)
LDYLSLPVNELLSACAEGNNDAAWREFVRRFHPLIAGVVVRVCRQWGENSRQLTDDIIQDVYLKLCTDKLRSVRNITPIDSAAVFGYVKVCAANHAHDVLKASHARKRGGDVRTVPIDDGGGSGWMRLPACNVGDVERELLFLQILKILDGAMAGPNADRDKRVFWLYYRLGLSASAIAGIRSMDLTTKGVESTILRMTRIIRAQLVAKRDKSGAGPDDERNEIPSRPA